MRWDLDKAFSFAQSAYHNLPNDPAIVDTLGWIYYKKKLLNQSAWLLQEAFAVAPEKCYDKLSPRRGLP